MTIVLFAQRKQWRLEGVEVMLSHERLHSQDCDFSKGDPNGQVNLIHLHIEVYGHLTPEQVAQLKEVARRCPVHRTLTSRIVIEDTLDHLEHAPALEDFPGTSSQRAV
jgi:putative redox protein